MDTAPIVRQKFQYDVAFQAKLCRALYLDPQFTCTTGMFLSPDHFERRFHVWAAKTIIEYATKHGTGIPLDALKIEGERAMKTGRLKPADKNDLAIFLAKCRQQLPDIGFIKEELYKFIKHQTIRETILESLEDLEEQNYDAIDVRFGRVMQVQASLSGGLGQSFVRDIDLRTDRRKEYVKNGVPTGLRLDEHLKPAGLPPGRLGCWLAPINAGKTHLLVHTGKAAILFGACMTIRMGRLGCHVLHITIEDGEDEILDRYDASFLDTPMSMLESRAYAVKKRVKEMGVKYGDCLMVKEFAQAELTVPKLSAYMRQLHAVGFFPDLLVIDYADEMVSTMDSTEKHDRQGNVYREIRGQICHRTKFNIPCWTACQTTRTGLGKEVLSMADAAESWQKPMVSDVFVAFCQTEEEYERNRARALVIKNRLGAKNVEIPLKTNWSTSTVISL